MLTQKAVVRLERPLGAFILNLPLFPTGPTEGLKRIPDSRGVYAFFHYVSYPADPDELFQRLVSEVEKKKFADRSAALPPYYGVTLRSVSGISERKIPKLRQALRNESFRKEMLELLENSLLFQSPLYVGKTKNLSNRIWQHMEHGSELRERLKEAGYSIENTSILLMPSRISEDEDTDLPSDIDTEGLTEEILSRLFHANFTLRIG